MNKKLENVVLSLDEEQNWRSGRNNVVDKLNHLLTTNIMSDVTFLVGENKESIKAHKLILSMGSNVFETMFNNLWDNLTTIIEVPDVEVNAFNNTLKFIYTDEVELTPNSVEGTLYAARKYEVLLLEEYCVKFLKSNLNTSNAFKVLSVATLYDISELTIQSLKLIDIYTKKCIDSKCFIDIDCDILEIILLRDTLMIEEIYLYEAIIEWSESECDYNNLPVNRENQLSVLKNCAKLIRYPLMNMKEFAAGPGKEDLLNRDQKLDYFMCKTLGLKSTFGFSNKPRSQICEIICNRFEINRNYFRQSQSSTEKYAFGFEVNSSIFIVGFGLCGCRIESTCTITITLTSSSSTNTIASKKVKIELTKNQQLYPVKFDFPVLIFPNVTYYAAAVIKDLIYQTEINKKKREICKIPDGDDIIFTFKPVSQSYASYRDGQIPQIIFYA